MANTHVGADWNCAEGVRRLSEPGLAEADHRIANSLSLVAAMLRMQREHTSESTARTAIFSAEARVLGIAHFHGYLHSCGSDDGIDLADIFTELLPRIEAALGISYRMAINIARPLTVSDHAARQLIIIINELAMNALKHGYDSREGGCIFIELDVEGEDHLRIRFADGGTGLPDGFDPGAGMGLGLKIVHSLVRELGGSLSTKTDRRPYFTMVIPIDGLRPGPLPSAARGIEHEGRAGM
ncbi:MAG: sensor histidine kinase [Oceanicaulis sp.]|nr:sensor histidine kinase [Oceanicaulis sp.]